MFLSLIVLLTVASNAIGELTDHGPDGAAFHDDQTARFWLDPAVFRDASRDVVDRFVTASDTWRWAAGADIDALVGASVAPGVDIESVLGVRQATVGSNAPRWLGFYAATSPDGYLAQAHDAPHETVDAAGTQDGTASLPHGAWLLTDTDPTAGSRLDHLGTADVAYFHDQATGLYWCDPETFTGLGRTGVDAWLVANPDWRWATLDEVYGLLGKFVVGDAPLTDVLGTPQQIVTGGVPRWLGYCSGIGATDAVLLQAGGGGIVRPLLTENGLQHMADESITAAWIVSDVNPTPVRSRTLGEIKAIFR
jgi:hypothetical protein